MPDLNDPADVAREYASERRLAVRRSFYDELHGEDVREALFDMVLGLAPAQVLEVGPGTGQLAQRLVAAGVHDYRAIDISPRMAQLTRERGVSADIGDIQALPFTDGSFDCVIAAWMLYHVPDLNLGLSEIARVLTPGGYLVAVTNSVAHLDELWSLVGHERWSLPFTAENGREILERHFAKVVTRQVEAWITLPDDKAVRRYINASPTRAHLADRVPVLAQPLRVGSRTCIFIATKHD
jgi:ubiquinone/menaquinone biosynthesis C-methylase UbiE